MDDTVEYEVWRRVLASGHEQCAQQGTTGERARATVKYLQDNLGGPAYAEFYLVKVECRRTVIE